MDSFAYPRKRARTDFAPNGNGAVRGYGSGSFGSGRDLGVNLGSSIKTKAACTKFFSTSGCPFGEECHFSHFVVGGVSALGLPSSTAVGKSGSTGKKPSSSLAVGIAGRLPETGAGLGGVKTRLCNKFGTSEGCRFGENCHFAHGEKELWKGSGDFVPTDRDPLGMELPKDYMVGRGGARGFHESSRVGSSFLSYHEPTPPGLAAAASFGASSTAKISIDASLAGAIIGKSGVNAKQICRLTGAKLAIRDHETDSKLKNVEMEGSFDQIKLASQMVRELLVNKDVLPPPKTVKLLSAGFGSSNLKTKMCENFPRGTCTFGERCHFAHGANELRDAASRF